MSRFTVDDVKKLAKLAMLELNLGELKRMTSELDKIFEMIEQINSFDTDGIEPTNQVTGLEHVTRNDVVIDYQVSANELVDGASDSQGGSIKVPEVK